MPNEMTEEQKKHLENLNNKFIGLNTPKYINGTIEHSGGLWELSVFQLALAKREEVLDQWNYNETQIDNILKLAQRIIELLKVLESGEDLNPQRNHFQSVLTEIYDNLVGTAPD